MPEVIQCLGFLTAEIALRTDESGERYCVLTGGEEEEACASLRNEGTNHLQDKNEYLKLAEPQFKDSRNSPIYVDRESHA